MSKDLIIVGGVVILILVVALVARGPNENSPDETAENSGSAFVQCLAEAGVAIYGHKTCPACARLAANFGGYAAIDSIFTECNAERERCVREMQTDYVPEIQIRGTIYGGPKTPEALAEETGCAL